ncbi:MAG: hypothetical protein ACRENJ_09825 [Candidatus Eiseniibacteriota bacterium]
MQNLSSLITCARASGQWIACRFGSMWSTSSRIVAGLAQAFEPCRLPAPVPLPVQAPRLRRVALVPALMLVVAAAAPADAAHGSRYEFTADGRLVDVQVLVGGDATPLYFPAGRFDRRYFQAFRGRNYALAVSNNTGRRIGVLIAVDGLNVVNGERSRLAAGEAMYVLDPWERTVIRGWRSSLSDVRKFVFVDEERSYAERTGQANGDMGWIRVLAFNERGHARYDAPGRIKEGERARDNDEVRPYGSRDERGEERRDLAEGAPEAQGQDGVAPRKAPASPKTLERGQPPSAQSVPGTGWGEKRWDPVQRVWFVPEHRAADHLVFRYEYASGLRALGIFPRGQRDRLWEREHGELGFAQPPRW